MCGALHYLLDNIFIRFVSRLFRQIIGISIGTKNASPVADSFLFCYERDFMFLIINKLMLLSDHIHLLL